MASNRISVKGTLILAFITCANAFPQSSQVTPNRRPKQDDDDAPSSINFGAQVAQIIAGAFTGNIDSIIKGSFGFIDDPEVSKLSHNTWETLKGNRPQRARSTTVKSQLDAESQTPAPEPPKVQEAPASPPQTAAVAPVVATPPKAAASPVQSQSAPEHVYAPDVYYPGSPHYPTRSPVRTTQPTYATLAPLLVIEETTSNGVILGTERTTTEESDDGDESEGLSAEIGDNAVGSTTKASAGSSNNKAPVTNAGSGVTSTVRTDFENSTDDDDDDQDQIDYREKA